VFDAEALDHQFENASDEGAATPTDWPWVKGDPLATMEAARNLFYDPFRFGKFAGDLAVHHLEWSSLLSAIISAKELELAHQEFNQHEAEPAEDSSFEAESLNDQLALNLPGSFAPTKQLTDFWVRGVSAFAHRAGISSVSHAGPEVQQEFAKMLSAVLGTEAQQIRYGSRGNLAITSSGRFLLEYQTHICDRFFIIPDEGTVFLQLLREELIAAVSKGCTIAGAWGRVSITPHRELCFALTSPNVIHDPDFVPSEEVD
jgi:hypothetical protein